MCVSVYVSEDVYVYVCVCEFLKLFKGYKWVTSVQIVKTYWTRLYNLWSCHVVSY